MATSPRVLLDCPNEILALIFGAENLDGLPSTLSPPPGSSSSRALCRQPILSLQDLRSLTLVSGRISDVANPILYERSKDQHESSAVAWSARNGSIPGLNKALSFGLNIHRAASQSPLHIAAQHGQDKAMHWLLDHGVDVDTPDTHRCLRCPWKHALEYHHSCETGRCPSAPTPHQTSALHRAICNGHTSSAITLITRGASLRYNQFRWRGGAAQGYYGHALTDALYSGSHDIVAYVVQETEADLNDPSIVGDGTCVHATLHNLPLLAKLLDLGLRVNGPGTTWHESHLRHALREGQKEQIWLLFERGARVDAQYVPDNATVAWTPTPVRDVYVPSGMRSLTYRSHQSEILQKMIEMGMDVGHLAGQAVDASDPLRAVIDRGTAIDLKRLVAAGTEFHMGYLRHLQQKLRRMQDWFDVRYEEVFEKTEVVMRYLAGAATATTSTADREMSDSTRTCLQLAANHLVHKDVFSSHLVERVWVLPTKDRAQVLRQERGFLKKRVALANAIIDCALDGIISAQHLEAVRTWDSCDQGHHLCRNLIRCGNAWEEAVARVQKNVRERLRSPNQPEFQPFGPLATLEIVLAGGHR